MGNTITNWARTQSVGGGVAKAILLCLSDSAKDYERGRVSMSIPQIAAVIEFSKRSIIDNLATLEKNKIIARDKTKKSDGTNNPNVYQILCPSEIFDKEVEQGAGDAPPSAPDALGVVREMHFEQGAPNAPSTVLEEEEFKEKNIANAIGEVSPTAKKTKFAKSKIDKRTKDPRSAHAAVQAVRSLMGRYPDKLLWNKIISKFGEHFNKDKLSSCRETWIERGYNPNATTWLNWYFDGIPERNGEQNGSNQNSGNNRNGNNDKPPESANRRTDAETAAWLGIG